MKESITTIYNYYIFIDSRIRQQVDCGSHHSTNCRCMLMRMQYKETYCFIGCWVAGVPNQRSAYYFTHSVKSTRSMSTCVPKNYEPSYVQSTRFFMYMYYVFCLAGKTETEEGQTRALHHT
ncbi:unnamed protein product [Orchesella dallaii]|uniref:Uncharacterized protein n=1 Tax=Orchesella dallaii TaxID=48710 RepID=A0ABP1PTT1_9HEXA